MDSLSNITQEVFTRYFNTLFNIGYSKDSNLNKLLLLSILEEILDSELSYFVTEQDYKSIINAIYCIMGNSCLIDLPNYETFDSLIHKPKYTYYVRVSQDNIVRVTQDDIIRIHT